MILVRSTGRVESVDPVRTGGRSQQLLTWRHIDGRGEGAVHVVAVLHGATKANEKQISVGALVGVRGKARPIIEDGQPALLLIVEGVVWVKPPDNSDAF